MVEENTPQCKFRIKWNEGTDEFYLNAIRGSFTQSDGIDPDLAEMTVALSEAEIDAGSIPLQGTLEFSDGYVTINRVGMRLNPDSVKIDKSDSDINVSLSYMDSRFAWKYIPSLFFDSWSLNGEYNRRDDSGRLIEGSGTKSLSEMISYIGDIMTALPSNGSFSSHSIPDGTVEYGYPYVLWEEEMPHTALFDLCERYNLRITLDNNDNIHVTPRGNNAPEGGSGAIEQSIPSFFLTSNSTTYSSRIIPEKIRIICGRSRYQKEIDLEAVAFDPYLGRNYYWPVSGTNDGTVQDISYKPATGWETDLSERLEREGSLDISEIISRTLFKCYRPKDGTHSIGSMTFNRRQLIERMSLDLNEYGTESFDNDQKKRKQAYCFGDHTTEKGMSEYALSQQGTDMRVDASISLDQKNGLVVFGSPVYSMDGSNNIVPPDLKIECVIESDKYIYDVTINDGESGKIEAFKYDDIIAEYDINGNLSNGSDLTSKLNSAVTECLSKINDQQNPYSVIYNGIFDIYPDGIIDEVKWDISAFDPPTTTISIAKPVNQWRLPRRVRMAQLDMAREIEQIRNGRNIDMIGGYGNKIEGIA